MTRICYQERVNAGTPQPCTLEDLNRLLDNRHVADVCASIAALDTSAPDYEERKSILKRKLPVLLPHASCFSDGKRHAESAIPSGLAMLDVDHLEDPLAWWESTRSEEWIASQRIAMVAITPSGHGLRVVGERQSGESIPHAQQRLAKALGFECYDAVTHDLARASYMMPRSYVLYLDEETLCEMPDGSNALYPEDNDAPQPDTTVADAGGSLSYRGIPYADIVNALLVVTGNAGGAIQGERNTVYFTLCNNMRYICDFSADLLLRILPDFGLSAEERMQTIHSSLGRPRRDGIPVTMQSAISMAEQNRDSSETEDIQVDTAASLALPELPPLLKTLCRRLPENYHSALVMSSLPLLGTLATRCRWEYLDGQIHAPNFFTVCVAPAASGKSFIRKPFALLKTPLTEHDRLAEEAEKEYLKKKTAAKNARNQPEDPEVYYRIQPVNISIAKYLQQASRAGGIHLYSEAEEMDTLVKSESRGAWSQKSDLYRVGFDNQEYGQSYMNTEFTCSATVNVYYNLFISGTPRSMDRFFKDIENGLATRVSIVQLPDTTYADMPHFDTYSAKEQEQIIRWARKLDATSGMLRCAEVDRAISRWLEDKRQQAIDSDSRAADVFRRRAGVIGHRAGMLSTLLFEGKKSAQQAADFAVYAAEYTFRAQMNMWGERMEREISAAEDMTGSHGEAAALLTLLPEEFTTQMLIALRSRSGQSVKPSAIKTLLCRWRKHGRIMKISEGHYHRLQ